MGILDTINTFTPEDSPMRQAWENAVKDCCTRAITRYPDETKRILTGYGIVMEDGVHVSRTVYTIQSQTKEDVQYQVNGSCPCPDAQHRAPEGRCKHRWAKALYVHATKELNEQPLATVATQNTRICFYCRAPEGTPLAETGPCCVAHLWYTFPPAPQEPHPRYYATYYPDDQRKPSLQGQAQPDRDGWLFTGETGVIIGVPLARLVLGGRVDLCEMQRAVDGESLGFKFGQPQYPSYRAKDDNEYLRSEGLEAVPSGKLVPEPVCASCARPASTPGLVLIDWHDSVVCTECVEYYTRQA